MYLNFSLSGILFVYPLISAKLGNEHKKQSFEVPENASLVTKFIRMFDSHFMTTNTTPELQVLDKTEIDIKPLNKK